MLRQAKECILMLTFTVRRLERVIRIFPNRESVIRLIGSLLMEQDEKWAARKKYLDIAEYLKSLENRPKTTSKVTRIVLLFKLKEFTH
jgi:putative transposase